MKLRGGFVSNSSSSSFFIPLDKWGSTKELAKYMLDVQEESWKNHRCSKEDMEALRQWRENLEIAVDDNPNVSFPSCNFDTYITKITRGGKEYLYVATCNNEQWDLSEDSVIPEDADGSVYDGEYDEEYVYGNEFLRLDTGLKEKKTRGW